MCIAKPSSTVGLHRESLSSPLCLTLEMATGQFDTHSAGPRVHPHLHTLTAAPFCPWLASECPSPSAPVFHLVLQLPRHFLRADVAERYSASSRWAPGWRKKMVEGRSERAGDTGENEKLGTVLSGREKMKTARKKSLMKDSIPE